VITETIHRGDVRRELLFRPRAQPAPGVPLGARSIGRYRVGGDWRDGVATKHFLQVVWGVRGHGSVLLDGERLRLAPGEVAIHLPGMTHDIRAEGGSWEYVWWTVDGPLLAAVIEGYGLQARRYEAGPFPPRRFRELWQAIAEPTLPGERRAGAIAYDLLGRIAGEPPTPSSEEDDLVDHALHAIQQRWDDPALSVAAIARELAVHRSVLSRRFTARHGVAPATYLINLRIQHAQGQLTRTTLPIAEIARRSGYPDASYFARLFRRHTGLTPRQFRRSG